MHKNINDGDLETQCKCVEVSTVKNFNNKIFKIRSMTPREFGLCVDLKKPIICPAVRYYDSSKEYIDDNLALGKTKEEMDENNQQRYYEQHLWRTSEKIMGIIPSVFYSNTLGHAEFPASVYCEKEEDCIGGSKNVEGTCLGYWKTNVDKPVAICEVKQYKGKNVYEYKIKSGTECVRYSCPGIGNISFLDEFEINKNTSNVFMTSEISEFNNIKRTDYRSFINNEEIDVSSVDKRGLSNGFAVWENIESDDFVKKGNFLNCLTGYGVAGSNYEISQILLKPNISIKDSIENSSKYYKKLIKEKYHYFNDNLVDHSVRKLIYGSLYDSVYNCTTGQSDYNNIPKRYCNQKGEWMLVEDVYSKMVLDSNIYDNNLYHSDISSNLWLTIFNIDRDDISNNTTNYLADKISKYGYCERLVCKPIMQTDENYYMDEFFNSDNNNNYNKNMYMFWLHSGGADWKATSSPRNSSSGEKLIYDEITDVNNIEFSSRKLRNIFSSLEECSFDDYIISNKYKYLKKVEGECKKEFGYYNRGTEFSSKDINTQIEKVKNSLNNKDNKYELANRDCSLNQGLCKEKCINLGNNASDCDKKCSKDSLKSVKCSDSRYVTNFTINGKDKPYRVCTSTGAWGEITNKCVRSCELLHLYRTNIDSDLYSSSEPSNVFNEDLKVENHNILSFNIDDSIENSYKEGRFLMYNFRYQELKNKNNYTQGEFIFGGADWPRSIVSSLEINNNYDCDSNGKCLRYIEVEGECNKEYETIDVSNPTQYVNSSVDSNKKPIKPKRKCYEDGTWGKVENRCILEKSCVNLDLYVSDVAKLIKKYNMSNTTLNDLNNTLSEIYVQHNKGNINEVDKLFTISAGGATAGSPISCNNITGVSGFETIKVGENEFACSSTGCCGNGVISMVCNSSDKLGTYIAGWSFNAFKLEKYFIPKTCSIKLIRDTENNNIHLKIDGLANNSFVCSSSDLYSRIDRLNFSFGANVNDYTISSLAKHYASESKLDLVYNSINTVIVESGYVIKKATGGSINAGVDDLSNKTINIDGTIGGKGGEEKIYYSHQIYATCDNRYFYNEISENNSENDYYNKLAIFSCQEENSVYKFTPINDEINKDQKLYESVKSNQYLLKGKSNTNSLADACQPKTCGGVGNNYQTGWSESFVKEFVDNENKKYNNTNSNTKFSTLKCPEGYAFVIDDKSSLDKNKNVELYYESNNENYSAYGFVQSLKVTCTGKRSENAYSITNEPYEVWNDNNKSSFRKINNKYANAYDANRHGDLQYEDLPKTFCRDIAKTNCNAVTEQEIINSGNIFIAKYGDKYENTE